MRIWARPAERRYSRRTFGLFLCLLLMTFAVANKAAGYHHQDSVRGLTHTKVWQNNQDAVSMTVADFQVDMLLAAVLFLVLPVVRFASIWQDERPPFSANWFVPPLAVRPPPSR